MAVHVGHTVKSRSDHGESDSDSSDKREGVMTAAVVTGPADDSATYDRHHLIHRTAHAVYGLILLTATVGELRVHHEDARTAIYFIVGGAAVLVVAHSYSQLAAHTAVVEGFPPSREFVAAFVDQLALAIPAAVATVIFLLAEWDIISLDSAYSVTIGAALVALFVLGLAIGLHRHRQATWALGMGVANVAVAVAVIAIEAGASH